MESGLPALALLALVAAFVTGALGYGFSSLTVPVGLLYLPGRILNPALVLVEVVLNLYVLFVNRGGVRNVWRRVSPILLGLVPGIALGSYVLASIHPGWLKLATFAVLLPLLLVQAAGIRRPIRAERLFGVPFGAGLGFLYSVTTISGPPLALLFNNQGYVQQEFRAGLALIRSAESLITGFAYWQLGLFMAESASLLVWIVPGVLLGVPLGAWATRRLEAQTFRRACVSFDLWIVGFALSRVLLELKLASSLTAYAPLALAALIDLWLLGSYVQIRRNRPAAG